MARDILGKLINTGDTVALAAGAVHGRANLRVGTVKAIAEGDDPIVRVQYGIPVQAYWVDENSQCHEETRLRPHTIRKFASQVIIIRGG